MKLHLIVGPNKSLYAHDEASAAYLNKKKVGTIIEGSFSTPRNYKFLQKAHCMCKVAFDRFEVKPVNIRGQEVVPLRDYDEFRAWLTVQAGFFDVHGYPDGSVRVRAKSWSYGSMEEEEFERMYSAILDVILEKIVDMPKDRYEELVDQMLNFM